MQTPWYQTQSPIDAYQGSNLAKVISKANQYYDLAKSYIPAEVGELVGDSAKLLPIIPLALNAARIGGLAYKGAKWLGKKIMNKFGKKKIDGVKQNSNRGYFTQKILTLNPNSLKQMALNNYSHLKNGYNNINLNQWRQNALKKINNIQGLSRQGLNNLAGLTKNQLGNFYNKARQGFGNLQKRPLQIQEQKSEQILPIQYKPRQQMVKKNNRNTISKDRFKYNRIKRIKKVK